MGAGNARSDGCRRSGDFKHGGGGSVDWCTAFHCGDVCRKSNQPMSKTLREQVDRVINAAGDYEAAHTLEDKVMQDWIREIADPETLAEFERMWAADFPRYCA